MIPVSNKTRSITRLGYTHASFWQQEKWWTDFAFLCTNSAEDSSRYNRKNKKSAERWPGRLDVLGGVPLLVKMRLNVESSLG